MQTKVVIIGAGASGLQASRLMRQAGHEVVVLEARDRVGGRIYTTKHEVFDAQGKGVEINHDQGAAWVHGLGFDWPKHQELQDNTHRQESTINPMLSLLEESVGSRAALFDKELTPFFKAGNPWVRPKTCLYEQQQLAIYCNGKIFEDRKVLKTSLKRHLEIMGEVDDIGDLLMSTSRREITLHQSLHETLDRVMKKKDIQRHKKVYGKNYKVMEQLRQFYVHLIEIWYAGSSNCLQLSEFVDPDGGKADNDYSAEGDFYGPHCTLTSGMNLVIQPLIGHGETILLEKEVVRIRDEGDSVIAELKSGETLEAEACIVTIPIACLKENPQMFSPKLSSEKQESVGIIRVGKYKKVFLTFDRIFWAASQAFVGFLLPDSDSPLGQHLLADNLWVGEGLPCLEIILIAEAADWATGKPTEEIRDEVLAFLSEALGMANIHQSCIECHVSRWEEDPYSRGAYSTFGTGCDERHTDYLRKAEWGGKLVFAGEHTVSEYEGSVHAALFSGVNACTSVCDYLNSKVQL